jgi:hypothetical protein
VRATDNDVDATGGREGQGDETTWCAKLLVLSSCRKHVINNNRGMR